MEIDEIKERMCLLEQKIGEAISEFENNTKTHIDDIEITRIRRMGPSEIFIKLNVKIK